METKIEKDANESLQKIWNYGDKFKVILKALPGLLAGTKELELLIGLAISRLHTVKAEAKEIEARSKKIKEESDIAQRNFSAGHRQVIDQATAKQLEAKEAIKKYTSMYELVKEEKANVEIREAELALAIKDFNEKKSPKPAPKPEPLVTFKQPAKPGEK